MTVLFDLFLMGFCVVLWKSVFFSTVSVDLQCLFCDSRSKHDSHWKIPLSPLAVKYNISHNYLVISCLVLYCLWKFVVSLLPEKAAISQKCSSYWGCSWSRSSLLKSIQKWIDHGQASGRKLHKFCLNTTPYIKMYDLATGVLH